MRTLAVGEVPWRDVELRVDMSCNFISHQLVFGDGKSNDAIWITRGVVLIPEAMRPNFSKLRRLKIGSRAG